MSKKIYALLVGINNYSGNVTNLKGAVNDVNHVRDFLLDNFKQNLCMEILRDSDACRANIIKLFKEHLCKAGKDDVVYFHYSGHGARESAAPEFYEFYPDKKDETLVCYDSRSSGGFDLADKELAVLLAQVAEKNPHIAITMDCCHSGSITRDVGDVKLGAARQTTEWDPGRPRPLETYLDGYFEQKERITIPTGKHVLLAACDRTEKAWETGEGRGLFSTILMKVLEESGRDISYADLYVRCRAAMRQVTKIQNPQFETFARFPAYTKFLGGEPIGSPTRYFVSAEKGSWKMECGALHGLPTDPGKKIEVALYPDAGSRDTGGSEIAGYGTVLDVQAQKSTLLLDFPAAGKDRYRAEILSLPVPPTPVYLAGDEASKAQLVNSLAAHKAINIVFVEDGTAKYGLSAQAGRFLLNNRETGILLQGVEGDPRECSDFIFSILEKVIGWERSLSLQNRKTSFKSAEVDYKFFEIRKDGQKEPHPGSEVTLHFVKEGADWREIRGELRLHNRSRRELHFTLAYFSEAYGVYILKNDPLPAGNDWVTLWGDGEDDYFYLSGEKNAAVDIFKLIISTERVDDFLLMQEELELGKIVKLDRTRAIGTVKRKKMNKSVTDDWFTKTITIETVRRRD